MPYLTRPFFKSIKGQNRIKNHLLFTFWGLILLLCPHLTQANQHSIGDTTIHYNALNSALIPAEVAAQYGITRSNRNGLVNISVIKSGKPVIANIFGHATNLAGQFKELAFKEVKEEKAIYYIATFSFSNAEKVNFDLQIQAEKQGLLIPLKFKQQLFSE